jgi:hypothetical protein
MKSVYFVHNKQNDFAMKKIFTLLASFCTLTAFSQLLTYNGNGNTGFGGPIGGGSLSITNDGTNINFTLTRGPGNMNDALVIYIDSKTGGVSSTSSLSDVADGLRTATSGLNGTNRSLLNFSSGFTADYAIALKPTAPENFAAIFDLSTPSSFGYVGNANLNPINSATATSYTFSCTKTQLGISGTIAFRFVASCISLTAFRANEAIGFAISGGNPGNPSTVSAATWATYNNGTAPVLLSNFSGQLKSGNAQLTWHTSSEINFNYFEVEQSTDSKSWSKIGKVISQNNTNGSLYTFDAGRIQSNTLYRLKMIDKDGSYAYSKQVLLKNSASNSLTVANVVNGNIKVMVTQQEPANYQAVLYTLDGKKLSQVNYVHQGQSGSFEVQVPSSVKGLVLLQVSNESNTQVFKVLAQ